MRTKTGGRTAGTPNKMTSELRNTLKTVIAGELDTITDTLAELPPKDRLDVAIRLMAYCLPKVDPIGGKYDSGALLDWD